jgi:c-di-GMP-binding flagellar brake protein YcgR
MISMNDKILIEQLFAPGSRVVIEYIAEQGSLRQFNTKVEDLEGNYIALQNPMVDGVPVNFKESQELTLRRMDDQKLEAYVTNVFVIDIRQGEVPLLVCSKPKKINKTSLRRFCRFPVDLSFNYSTGGSAGSGSLNDLSVSGCYALIDADAQIASGINLKLAVQIPAEAELHIKGKVIRVDRPNDSGKTGLAIDFVDLSDVEQEALYSYIFQLQLTADSILGAKPKNN